MLASLEITNYLLIKKLKINFDKGFNTFTGETGAGKSIIIEGLKLALGGRNFKNLNISKDENIEFLIVFDINQGMKELIKNMNIEVNDDYIIIKREINYEMKSKIFINGELTTQNQVKIISDLLIEIQDNYEQQELFNNKYFLNYIDKLSQVMKTNLIVKYDEYVLSKTRYLDLFNKKDKIDKEISYIEQILEKIEKLNPKKNEFEELLNKKNVNKNRKNLISIKNELMGYIDKFDESSEIYRGINKNIEKLSIINPEFNKINDKFNESYLNINEILNDIKSEISFDEDEMMTIDEIENRIYSYKSLSNVTDTEPNEIYKIFIKLKEDLVELKNFEKNLEKLNITYNKKKDVYIDEAQKISKIRKEKSISICNEINKNLPLVNIEQGEIKFNFKEKDEKEYSQDGIDSIDIGFRTNKNNEFSSIKKVASGGELSRLLLIMKSLISKNDLNKTVIFDEVDSGLSGKVAGVVANKIMNISKFNQVIAITHSPQVAARADKHWKIVKSINSNKVMESAIKELNSEDRVEEIANIISGSKISSASRKVAKDLLLK